MSNAIRCFRTVTRCGIFRQVVDESGVTLLVPIGIAVPPSSISINPGDSIEEPQELAIDGRMVVSFSYSKESKGELELEFSMATLEMESLIHGRVVKIVGDAVEGWIYTEFVANKTAATTARPTGMMGSALPALAADSKAVFYYLDPATKMAKKMTIVAEAPDTIDEIQVGLGMACTVSAALAAKGFQVYGWVPSSFTAGVVLSSTPLGILSVFAQGISFDNKGRLFTLRNCSRLPGGGVGSDSKRSIKMRILPDPLDGTGLGYTIIDTPALAVV